MRGIRPAAVLVAAALCTTVVGPAGSAQAGRDPGSPEEEAAARADAAIVEHREAVRGADDDEYRLRRVMVMDNGAAHVRYTREIRDLPVIGGDFVVHLGPDGGFAGVSVTLDRPISISTVPELTADEAVQVVWETVEVSTVGDPELVVDAAATEVRLAWRVPATAADGGRRVLVDARDGRIIRQLKDLQEVAGTGDSVYGGTVNLDTAFSGGQYQLIDPLRGNATTCDLNHTISGPCPVFTDADNAWGDGNPATDQSAAVDAHYGSAMAYDYYQSAHGRAGVFDNGVGVTSKVHLGMEVANAFWDIDEKVMKYGDGAGGIKPVVSLDVAGHEMTHGVTQNELPPDGLIYSGESGGLNEATSDIFGTMVEFYASNPVDPPDYLIGEKIDINGNGKPLRYMFDPDDDGISVNCWSPNVEFMDPHYSSGVGNHFFFLLAEGSGQTPYGFSPTCNGEVVTGIGRTKASAIWYHALRAYFTSAETYADARENTLAATADLYGRCSGEWFTVAAAWAAVGVGGALPCLMINVDFVAVKWPDLIPDPGPLRRILETDRLGELITIEVGVNIMHPRRGDLQIDIVAPNGESYRLKNANRRDVAPDVTEFYDVRLADPAQAGTWKLLITDVVKGAQGQLRGWTLVY